MHLEDYLRTHFEFKRECATHWNSDFHQGDVA